MKKFISKVKKSCHRFVTGKSGFSLVELIVVIAIMAVMAAVLAPALLGYVERSRAQKDDSAFSEVVNSVQLSLADQDVYDEMLKYSAEQYSCYVDSDSPDEANKVDIKAGKYYMYSDEERQLDETVYRLDGVMRGVTITFAPDAAASNSATLDLIKGHVNKYLPSGKKTYGGLTGADASPKLADIPESELYNSLRATIGDKISISSQTYRNSEYTVFISMGTTGGQEAAAQDAIKVWGQFSGTNLPEGSSVAANGVNAGTSAGSNEFKGGSTITPLAGSMKLKTWTGSEWIIETFTWEQIKSGAAAHHYISFVNEDVLPRVDYNMNLLEVVVPDGVKSLVSPYSFEGCNSLEKITLPNTIQSIGAYAFAETPFDTIYYNGTKEQWSQIEFANGWDGARRQTIYIVCVDGTITHNAY